jgi:hypothetical protein
MKKEKKAFSDPKAGQFLHKYFYSVILPYSVDHLNRNGYTQVWVKDDYTIMSMNFIEGRFNRKKFTHQPNSFEVIPVFCVEDVVNLYFEILYEATHRYVKFSITAVISGSTKVYDRFTLIPNEQ